MVVKRLKIYHVSTFTSMCVTFGSRPTLSTLMLHLNRRWHVIIIIIIIIRWQCVRQVQCAEKATGLYVFCEAEMVSE